MSNYFIKYNGEYGNQWESIFIPVMDAIKDRKIISEVTVEYSHPIEQTKLENADLRYYWERANRIIDHMSWIEKHWRK